MKEIHQENLVFIIPIKIIRTKYCIYLEKKKYKFVSRFFLHIMQPNIVKYFAIFITIVFHKKFLLLSSWTLVYFTHHLFYNEYFFFFFPSSFFRISQRFRLIDGNDILLRWTPARGQCIATVWTLYTHHVEVSRSKMIASCPVWEL